MFEITFIDLNPILENYIDNIYFCIDNEELINRCLDKACINNESYLLEHSICKKCEVYLYMNCNDCICWKCKRKSNCISHFDCKKYIAYLRRE